MRKLKVNKKLILAVLTGGVLLSSCSLKKGLNIGKEVYADSINQEKYESSQILETEDNDIVIDDVKYELVPVIEEEKPYKYIPAVEATTGLNVRSGPSTDYDVIGGMSTNTKLPYTAKDLGWYRIDYFGEEAYVCGDYVNETEMIIGTPIKIVYCNHDTLLTDQNGENHPLPQYELCQVYEEYPDAYLVSANNTLGIMPKVYGTELSGAYAVVDISDQRVDIYKDNELLLSTPCVTGKDETPTTIGCHTIHSEKHDDYLVGPGYKSYVNHFLAFHNGEGLHDATWRSVFGNDGYHENGSHGCVNLPVDKIEEVNSILSLNDKVLVKH